MAGRGATTFQKRQKEQMRKEKREEKLARRLEKKDGDGLPDVESMEPLTGPRPLDIDPALDRNKF